MGGRTLSVAKAIKDKEDQSRLSGGGALAWADVGSQAKVLHKKRELAACTS